MAEESLITPKTAAPAPADAVQPLNPSQEPAPKAGKGGLPDELLQLPALQAIFAGEPPAISLPLTEFAQRPEAKLLADNKDSLLKAGLALYRSTQGDLGVIFNQFYISPEDIKAADQAGTLAQLAPPFDAVTAQVGQAGAANPVLKDRQLPGGFATAQVSAPPQSGSPISLPPPATPAQAQIVADRGDALNQQRPADRGGRGKLLASVLRPV